MQKLLKLFLYNSRLLKHINQELLGEKDKYENHGVGKLVREPVVILG